MAVAMSNPLFWYCAVTPGYRHSPRPLLTSAMTFRRYIQSLFAITQLPARRFDSAEIHRGPLPRFTLHERMVLVRLLPLCTLLAAFTLGDGGKDLSLPS